MASEKKTVNIGGRNIKVTSFSAQKDFKLPKGYQKFDLTTNPITSSVPDYVIQNALPLIRDLVARAKSIDVLRTQTGIKSAEAIERLNTSDPVWQPLGSGFNASGITEIDQRIVTVGRIQIQDQFAPDLLNRTFAQYYLKAGSEDNEMGTPVEDVWLSLQTDKIARQIEEIIWQGDTALTGSTFLKFADGLIKVISGCTQSGGTYGYNAFDGPAVLGNSGITGTITVNNVLQIIDALWVAAPDKILANQDSLVVFCGYDVYRLAILALKNQNLFNYARDNGADYEFNLPTTNVKVVGLHGLTGTNRVYLADPQNLVVGLDLANDFEDFTMWFSNDFNVFRMMIKFKIGTNVEYCSQIVYYQA